MERLGLKKKYNSKVINEKSNKKSSVIVIFICMLIPLVVFQGITLIIEPSVMALCEIRAKSIGITVSSKAVNEVMANIGYLDLITLDRDDENKIMALRANVIEMNRISSQIGLKIQSMYDEIEDAYIKIPIGNFTGNSLLSGRGPNITIRIIPVGTVSTDFKTEFISTGINQTRHRVYLEISNNVRIVAPLTSKTMTVVNNVNVAETVLIGDVPSSFYNLEGLSVDDSLNFLEQ